MIGSIPCPQITTKMLVENLPAMQDSAAARYGIFYRCKTYSSTQNTSSGIAIISHSKVKILGILDTKQVSLISDNQPTIFLGERYWI